jgi:hypothetical protein
MPGIANLTTGEFRARIERFDPRYLIDRDALFTAWNALANLADMAGRIKVTIEAESSAGFDKSKLQNGAYEPLREANLIE